MTDLPLPSPDPSCASCAGAGYTIRPVGARALATICDCIGPCERCGGSGQRRVRVDGRVRVGRCRCQQLPDRIELFNRAGIPARHAASSFSSFNPRRNTGTANAYRGCQSWCQNYNEAVENRGLVLVGEVGRGKTHLLVATLRRLILDYGVEARFVEFSHLLSQLKEGYDAGTGEATTLMPLVRVPVLAIDELGKGRGSDWELGIIDQLVSHRYNALGTILATTNYPFQGPSGLVATNMAQPEKRQTLGDRIGDRVFSRIAEVCDHMPVGGDDFRRKQRLGSKL
jgi:DNA replication protein DnaC